jgi:glycosyltransferase involved in cell wall biosynthesis
VDPESVDDIASSIRRVLHDDVLRADLVKAGRERSRSFTWQRCAEGTAAVLERVGAGNNSGKQHASS